MAKIVKAKVAAGEYANETEMIRHGVSVLIALDRAIDRWLREQVGPAYDALKADPSRAIPVLQMCARIAAEHKRATAAK